MSHNVASEQEFLLATLVTWVLLAILYWRLHMTEQELSDKIDKLGNDLAAALQALKDQIATLTAGQPVSQEQLDALGAKVDALDATVAPIVPPAV